MHAGGERQMPYVILLDRYVGLYGAGQYAVSDFGTLDFCQGQTRHDGTTLSTPKSHYREGASEPKELDGPEGNPDGGRILELTPVRG